MSNQQRDIDGSGTGQAVNSPYDRIFTCSGIGTKPGVITELRYGIEARIGSLIFQEDPTSVTEVWALSNFGVGGTFLLLSDPVSSTLISLPAGDEELSVLDDETSGLDLGVPTLAAATTRDRVAIQVTSSSLNLSVIGEPTLRYSSRVPNHPSERVIAAAASGTLSLLAAAIRNGDNIRIEIWKVERSEAGLGCTLIGQPISLAQEPICLAISRLDSRDLLYIGTSDGNLLAGWIDFQGPITFAQQTIEYPDDHDDSKACESLSLLITAGPGYPRHTLVCGLRSGYMALVSLSVSRATSEIRKSSLFFPGPQLKP
jgi:hypothetical protein